MQVGIEWTNHTVLKYIAYSDAKYPAGLAFRKKQGKKILVFSLNDDTLELAFTFLLINSFGRNNVRYIVARLSYQYDVDYICPKSVVLKETTSTFVVYSRALPSTITTNPELVVLLLHNCSYFYLHLN